jgi:multiple sugar transport system substrate-binding protein
MKKELLVRLDRYTDQDDSFDKDSLIPVFHNQCLWDDGALYAMPAYGTTQVMYYNRRLFESRHPA